MTINEKAQSFWEGPGGLEYHAAKMKRYADPVRFAQHDGFHQFRKPLLEEMDKWLTVSPDIRRLCEIGTGHGYLLKICKDQWGGRLRDFLGLDVNKEQMALNRERFPNLRFKTASISDWMADHLEIADTLFMAVGTLEYLTEDQLVDVFGRIQKGRSSIALMEPTDYLNSEIKKPSNPRSDYGSMNHNYGCLAREAGLTAFCSKTVGRNSLLILHS